MGKDKSQLHYWHEPQWKHVSELLVPFCEEVYLSCREGQVLPPTANRPAIIDTRAGMGPMGGILSAFGQHPDSAWLVVACDLPFLTREILELLVRSRKPDMLATAFVLRSSGLPEPVCTIYEPAAYSLLLGEVNKGNLSPQRVLSAMRLTRIELEDETLLQNINNLEEYAAALAKIKKLLK
ncbi:molybdopterin-guanine dinucleotide biosynthesis protein B [Lunatimonas lonarensis]|uniref:Molybdopterin-guanine dinucleotide biosynthesis protein B n=2 Tax=Lunatimonas lonarensis TaxID=1232681 RepID=R7ZV59_9BACT|nr:molybdopterin-guanine dinucleotide biosynthesis protein B [Lunatimonas lonarensis]